MSTAEVTTDTKGLDLKGLEVKETMVRNQETDEVSANVELVPSSGQDFLVFARTPEEMSRAQDALIQWGERKLGQCYEELSIREKNLQAAKDAKIRTAGWTREVKKWQEEITYRVKILEALKAGYYIVPEFPINIIGVRTTAEVPYDQGSYQYRSTISDEPHEQLPVGDGEYKDAVPVAHAVQVPAKDHEGKPTTNKRWTTEGSKLRDIDFPFRLIRPQLLQTLQKAMGEKIFDAIGVLPNQRKSRDPMLIGVVERVLTKYQRKRMYFLISWWIPTEDL